MRACPFDSLNPFRFYFEGTERLPFRVFDPEVERNCYNFVDQRKSDVFQRRAAAFTFRTPSAASYLFETGKLTNSLRGVERLSSRAEWEIRIRSINRPIYSSGLHALLFDPGLNLLQYLTPAVYRAFLGSRTIERASFALAQLTVVTGRYLVDQADLLKLLKFKARLHLNFEALRGFEPTLVGLQNNVNMFLSRMRAPVLKTEARVRRMFTAIPYPNARFCMDTKVNELWLHMNLKLLKQYKVSQFYHFENSREQYLNSLFKVEELKEQYDKSEVYQRNYEQDPPLKRTFAEGKFFKLRNVQKP